MSITKVLSEMVSFVPVSGITSTNVQTAIPESAANLASSISAPTGTSLVGYLPAGTGNASKILYSNTAIAATPAIEFSVTYFA